MTRSMIVFLLVCFLMMSHVPASPATAPLTITMEVTAKAPECMHTI